MQQLSLLENSYKMLTFVMSLLSQSDHIHHFALDIIHFAPDGLHLHQVNDSSHPLTLLYNLSASKYRNGNILYFISILSPGLLPSLPTHFYYSNYKPLSKIEWWQANNTMSMSASDGMPCLKRHEFLVPLPTIALNCLPEMFCSRSITITQNVPENVWLKTTILNLQTSLISLLRCN